MQILRQADISNKVRLLLRLTAGGLDSEIAANGLLYRGKLPQTLMRLSSKLIGLTILGISAISAASAVLQVHREMGFFGEETRNNVQLMGKIVSHMVSDAWSTGGINTAFKLIDEANRATSSERFRWVWFDAAAGTSEAPMIKDVGRRIANGESVLCLEAAGKHGEPLSFSYFPISLAGERRGGLEISASFSKLEKYIHQTIMHSIVLMISLALMGSLIIATGIDRLIGRPLRSLIERIRRIAAGSLEGYVDLRQKDELGELAQSINMMSSQLLEDRESIRKEMQARMEALNQLRHADRLRSVGRLASGVAHELGTPLNVILGRAGLIAADPGAGGDIIGSVEIIRSQCQRMTGIIRQLLDFARRNIPKRMLSQLSTIITETIALVEPLALKRHVRIDFTQRGLSSAIEVDPVQIEQVLTNLLTNAVQASHSGGRVSVTVDQGRARSPEENKEEVECYIVRVQDEGSGISPDDLPHIFEPFFTTKDTGDGTGLGLSIAHGIVQEHGGWIEVVSDIGKGSTFRVFLPTERSV